MPPPLVAPIERLAQFPVQHRQRAYAADTHSTRFATLGLEWASLCNLRRATAVNQAHEWTKLFAAVRRVTSLSALTLLATGISMAASVWRQQGWIRVGLGGLVLIAVIGATMSGRRIGGIIRPLAAENPGSALGAVSQRLRDPMLLVSFRLRTALAIGIVIVMSTKPSGGAAPMAIGVAVLVGLAAGLPAWSRGRRSLRAGAPQSTRGARWLERAARGRSA